ncbi:thiamine pyrophosphate-binding protein [Dactylosporangium sp. CA-092794]|uniref:thiamine pyrophosphate-binding protein n=1 Tax=Dactylosporangium sp. CA-092794 TaxID=3239929 RepID=UPI003D903F6D
MKAEAPKNLPSEPEPGWGSDAMAAVLRSLDLTYIALNPGSSYRGLHDSLVNFAGNTEPQMLLCLHEDAAVAIAHGWAKVTGRPMAVAVHANVGLMHASMALYNAYCDRVPMLVLGATGPLDARARRPWIDWIHTSADQGALIRPYTKWDDQPGSVQAALDSLAQAHRVTRMAPSAPTYVCLDIALQEQRLTSPPKLPDTRRDRTPRAPGPDVASVDAVHAALAGARRPVFLMGRVSRDPADWDRRVALAERYGARVVTDLKVGAAFPTAHPLHAGPPAMFLPEASARLLADADLILSLDWIDLPGVIAAAGAARVISCTLEGALRNGWAKDSYGHADLDLEVRADPDRLVAALLDREAPPSRAPAVVRTAAATARDAADRHPDTDDIFMADLAEELAAATAGGPTCLIRLPLGWRGADLHVDHPLDYLGGDGGAGIGSGPGMAVGAALALENSGRLPVAVLGDGDLLMGGTALWTAAHYEIPLLVVVANNAFYYNDVIHQDRVAARRGRPAENRWIGQAIDDPRPDLAGFARSLGLRGIGPVRRRADLFEALAEGVKAARAGESVLVDVGVRPDGYTIQTH